MTTMAIRLIKLCNKRRIDKNTRMLDSKTLLQHEIDYNYVANEENGNGAVRDLSVTH